MICPPCRDAGALLGAAKYVAPLLQSAFLDKAAHLHADCEAPATCPCHHHVGIDALQP